MSAQWIGRTAQRLAHPRHRGARLVLALLEARGAAGHESWFERLLAAVLESPMLADLVCQHELRRGDGRVVARFDLAIPRLRLAIEAHSRAHHVGDLVERADEARDLAVAALGWEVVYLGFAATRTPDDVRRQIERIAARRALDLDVPVLP